MSSLVFVLIVLILIIILGILGIFYINIYNNIQNLILRINEAENIIDDSLRKKYDILFNIINHIKKSIKIEESVFSKFNELNDKNISNFNLDRELVSQKTLINQIIEDYSELNENNEIVNLQKELIRCDEKLEATKVFYNKYTTELNKLIRTFPSNIISKIHKIKLLNYFDGKDMNDNIIDDFKL